jgi:hypothetical protein
MAGHGSLVTGNPLKELLVLVVCWVGTMIASFLLGAAPEQDFQTFRLSDSKELSDA